MHHTQFNRSVFISNMRRVNAEEYVGTDMKRYSNEACIEAILFALSGRSPEQELRQMIKLPHAGKQDICVLPRDAEGFLLSQF